MIEGTYQAPSEIIKPLGPFPCHEILFSDDLHLFSSYRTPAEDMRTFEALRLHVRRT